MDAPERFRDSRGHLRRGIPDELERDMDDRRVDVREPGVAGLQDILD